MPKVKISEYSSTANSNTDVASINIDEGCAPSGINNAIRAVMGHLKDFQTGAVGDPFNGPVNGTVGATTPATVAATTLTTSSTVTHNGGTANGVTYLNGSKVLTSGSALVFDGTKLGVGIASPLYPVQVKQSGTIYSSGLGVTSQANDSSLYLFGTGSVFNILAGYESTGSYQPIAFNTGGAERMRLDTSGNLGIGTTNPSQKLTIDTAGTSTTSSIFLGARTSGGDSVRLVTTQNSDGTATFDSDAGGNGTPGFIFKNTGTERMRINSSGNLLVGKTSSALGTAGIEIFGAGYGQFTANNDASLFTNRLGSDGDTVKFYRATSQVGSISVSSSATAYNTSSDYRLKNTIAPMTGALAKVAALKPVTYKWNADNSNGEGFIAHELQAVVPDCVTGEKDAVDKDGNPEYQGIDTSFLVATLTAAIQELKAIVDAQATRITALEGN